MSTVNKIIVFDLDETLGNFIQLGIFCDTLERLQGIRLSEQHFFDIVEMFDKFLRPNIIKILKYLKEKKINNECDKIMIYTNNQGPKEWCEAISKYFDRKIGHKIFDNIIAAFKVNGKRVELCRTSHDKSVGDLIKCTKIPIDTKICFLDDQFHPYMKHSNVYYINVKPYEYNYDFEEMAQKYYDKYFTKLNNKYTKKTFIETIVNEMNQYNFTLIQKTKRDLEIDIIISKRILSHLKIFFGDTVKIPGKIKKLSKKNISMIKNNIRKTKKRK